MDLRSLSLHAMMARLSAAADPALLAQDLRGAFRPDELSWLQMAVNAAAQPHAALVRRLLSTASNHAGAGAEADASPAAGNVVVFGSIAMDLIAEVPRFPQANATTRGHSFATKAGGKGANEAVALARLGVHTHLVGVVGDDEFGGILRSKLAAEGVDTRHVRVDPAASTGVALILVAQDVSGKSTVPCLAANECAGDAERRAVEALCADPATCALLLQLEVNEDAVVAAAASARACQKPVFLKVYNGGDSTAV